MTQATPNNAAPNSTPPSGRGLVAIILAAGRSTRMKTDLPKVMHEICGRPMLSYVLEACRDAGINSYYVIVGFGKDAIIEAYRGAPGVHFVEQREQKGTGHAVSMCTDALKDFTGDCVVIAGDMPLVRAATLTDLIGGHRATGSAASLATTILDDPSTYGRIIRGPNGDFEKIVEDRDCTPEQLKIHEVNPSYYCFDSKLLFESLPKIKPNNAKGELYITDVLGVLKSEGKLVRAATTLSAEDATGINSRVDLAVVGKMMQRRINTGWMERGVTIVDSDTTWIDSRAMIGVETVIRPFSYIEGRAKIGSRCQVGPYAYIKDGAAIDDGSTVGPGVLAAIESAAGKTSSATARRSVSVVRRPPAQSGIS